MLFDNLADIMKWTTDFTDGIRIFNSDETSTSYTVQKPQRVIAEKGVRQVSEATSRERGTLITCCIFPSWYFWESILGSICLMEPHQAVA